MIAAKYPMTAAIRAMKDAGIPFVVHSYAYEEQGGTPVAARELRVDEHCVIKTLVMETDAGQPLIVLMHGDRETSTRNLARLLAVKHVAPCSAEAAIRHTAYSVGGISPFGTRRKLPVYWERTIAGLPRLYINAGRRGLLAEMAPADLMRALSPIAVDVALRPHGFE